jgi:hypothetical protein
MRRKLNGERRRFYRRPFSPREPEIIVGEFAGRKLSELSDEELNLFMLRDARNQARKPVTESWFPIPPYCPDLSQYWFAKYELERRKPDAQREPVASLKIIAGDTKEEVAWKLVQYGFRAASRKYHPDKGGDTRTMQRVNEAQQFAKERLKT